MDWLSAISNIFSIFESIAVVASLIYLGRQVQSNTKATKGATYQNIVLAFAELESRISQNSEISRLYKLARENPEELNNDERFQMAQIMATFFNMYENLYYQYKNGLLDSELWQGWCKGLMYDLENKPGVKQWWEQTRPFYSKEFCNYLDKRKCQET